MIKILIIDNQISFNGILASSLRADREIEVIGAAESISDALEIMRTDGPDIVLMGSQILNRKNEIRHNSEFQNTKIVVLTDNELDEELFTAVRNGANGFLSKNIQPVKLIAAIRSVMKGEGALSRAMTQRLMTEFSRTKKPEPPLDQRLSMLTQRELDVFQAMAAGKKNPEIAAGLYLAENTVKYHVHSILGKLKLPDRKAVAAFAREQNLIKE